MSIEGYNMDFKCLYFVSSLHPDALFWGNCEAEKGHTYHKKMHPHTKGKQKRTLRSKGEKVLIPLTAK